MIGPALLLLLHGAGLRVDMGTGKDTGPWIRRRLHELDWIRTWRYVLLHNFSARRSFWKPATTTTMGATADGGSLRLLGRGARRIHTALVYAQQTLCTEATKELEMPRKI